MADFGRRRSLLNTVRLGLRLARAGGKVRMALVVVGAMVGALMILIAFSIQHVVDTQWTGNLEREPFHEEVAAPEPDEWIEHDDGTTEVVEESKPQPLHAADPNSTLQLAHGTGGELGVTDEALIRYVLGDGPSPPGVAAVPDPNEAYLSPALLEHVEQSASAQEKFAGFELHEVSREGLGYPNEYVAYIGVTEAQFPGDVDVEPSVLSWGISYADETMLYNPQRGTAVPIFAFMLAPAILLLATTTRLASSVRTERMAALRLLGINRFRTRLIAGIEAASLALAGVALAVAILPLLGWLTAGRRLFGLEWFAGDFHPALPAFIATVLFVPVITVLTAFVVLRKISHNPLQVRRKAANPAPSYWRLIPLALGTVALVLVVRGDLSTGAEFDAAINVYTFLAGAVLVGFGILLAIPVFIRRVAGLLGKNTSSPSVLLAARRTQYEPAILNRLVGGLILVLFIATGGQAVILAFEKTPQYQRAVEATSGESTYLRVDSNAIDMSADPLEVPEDPALTTKQLEAVGLVESVVPLRFIRGNVEYSDTGEMDLEILVASCAELARLGDMRGECSDDAVRTFAGHYGDLEHLTVFADGQEVPIPPHVSATDFAPETDILYYDLSLPPSLPELQEVGQIPPTNWLVEVPANQEAWAQVQQEINQIAPEAWVAEPQTYALEEVANVRMGIWLGTAVAGSIAIITLLITAIDNGIARRPQIAMQRAFGVSLRRVRRSQLLQALLPLVVGVPLAGAAGILAGQAYTALDVSGPTNTYWAAVAVTLGLAVGAAILLALATLPAIGGKITPQSLRRE